MKQCLSILFWLLPVIALPQVKDTLYKTLNPIPIFGSKQSPIATQNRNSTSPYKPEILTSGFIDIVNNGQVNASARFIRLFIGR